MKRITKIVSISFLLLAIAVNVNAAGASKTQKRIAYTLKNLKLSTQQQKDLQPLLQSYCAELKAAKKPYDDLKSKYERDIDNGTLTDKASEALLNAKFTAEAKELQIKKTYQKKFEGVIPMKKVYICFDLINDKMSKVEGKKKSSKDDDDD